MKISFSIVLIILTSSVLFSHCQVPCGIYDDAARIKQIQEDITTIQKAMKNINELSNNKTVPQDLNQLVRWVNTKEEHAQHIQDVIMQYFLAQRVKPKNVNDEGYTKYVSLTISCQKIIFHAMKCKQNTEVSYSEILLKEVNLLIDSYFDDHGKLHLNELMSK
jgi:nickel superoxide dismutase